MNFQKRLEKLLPYATNNIISYDLWEEGIYNVPFFRIFQVLDKKELKKFEEKVEKLNNNNLDYVFEIEDKDCYRTMNKKTYTIVCFPNFEYNKDGSIYHIKDTWSIEEMIDLMVKLVK